MPVIYKSAYESYKNGLPIFKGLGWEYPADKRSLRCNSEYLLGANIIARPVTYGKPVCLDKKDYLTPVKATYYNGRELNGEPIATAEYDTLDMVLYHTSPEAGVPVYDFSARFEAEIKLDSDCELFISCDDGATVWIDGEKVLEDKTLHSALTFPLKKIKGGIVYKIIIEYFQAGGEACCGLFGAELPKDDKIKTYLPAGKWLDAFSGKIYSGGKTISRGYGLQEMPLFIRLGALIPLAHEAHNTKLQKWDKLVYDFYPCKDATDRGYLYEDDTETTAYKLGQCRKSAYEAYYCEDCNAYVIKLHAAEGKFEGEKCFNKRKITVKYHLLKDAESVRKVTVNGEEVGYKKTKKDSFAFPLNTSDCAPDGGVICVPVVLDVDKEYEIKFHL